MSGNKNNQEPQKTPINPLYIYALIGLAVGSGIITPLSTLYHRKLPSFIPVEKPEIWNLEAQIKLFAHVAFFAGIVIFINSLIVANSRLLTRKLEPHSGTEPFFIAIMNQALRNNVEQTLPFLCSYLYWLVSRAKESDIELAYIFGFLFVVYRVLFVLGYTTGLFLPITNLRAIGFLGTITVNMILIEESLGLGLLSWNKLGPLLPK